jgi:hypothetical protein
VRRRYRVKELAMPIAFSPSRRAGLCAAACLIAGTLAWPAVAHWPRPAQTLAHLEVHDRVTGATLPVYEKDGRRYIVGVPGHEYALRISNRTGGRILAVTSVDGVNVITGDTATPSQSGYVIEPWSSVEIAGWRKSMSRTAAFFFTEHANSYAARTGRPFDVGVIGLAVFAERIARPTVGIGESHPRRSADAPREEKAEPAAPAAQAPAESAASRLAEGQRDDASRERRQNAQPMAKLGTGHGRSETSHVRQVAFERATSEPAQVVAIQYDRHENLVALGVLPPDRYAHRAPQPFPGLRFAPDPR